MSGVAVHLPGERGHAVTTRAAPIKPSQRRKGSKRVKFVRSLIREVVGFAPYEKRILEMLKNDMDKKALKFAKKRLGTHKRAKSKREELTEIARARRK